MATCGSERAKGGASGGLPNLFQVIPQLGNDKTAGVNGGGELWLEVAL
jgi:hypothetical protein